MVLAFTEKQKKEIEAKRMMVIEFKYNLRKAGKIIKEAWCRMKEIVDKEVKVRSIQEVDCKKLLLISPTETIGQEKKA